VWRAKSEDSVLCIDSWKAHSYDSTTIFRWCVIWYVFLRIVRIQELALRKQPRRLWCVSLSLNIRNERPESFTRISDVRRDATGDKRNRNFFLASSPSPSPCSCPSLPKTNPPNQSPNLISYFPPPHRPPTATTTYRTLPNTQTS
jgi:hypothetical protein